VTALAAALGLTCMTLDRAAGSRASNLARIVLSLLAERGPEARALVETHALQCGLPLALMGGVPVWDRLGHDEARARRPAAVPIVARRVAAFFLDIARSRPLALVVAPAALNDPLAAAVVAKLRRAMTRAKRDRSATGGFLLALPAQ
jgi:hypothetical protein